MKNIYECVYTYVIVTHTQHTHTNKCNLEFKKKKKETKLKHFGKPNHPHKEQLHKEHLAINT